MSENLERQIDEAKGREAIAAYAGHELANLETYKYFNQRGVEAEEAKRSFIDAALDGDTPASPGFVYPGIDSEQWIRWRDSMTELVQKAVELDMNNEANRIVRENITNRLHEVGAVLLAKIQSELGPDHPLYEAASMQLAQNLREIYGVPNAKEWRGILGLRLQELRAVEDLEDVPDDVMAAWQFIKQHLPQDLKPGEIYQPKQETVDWYAAQLNERLRPARGAVAEAVERGEITLVDGKLDAHNIVKATRLALQARGAQGWEVELTDESNIDTSQADKKIYVPRTRFMSMEQFDAVMLGHEIDEHVITRVNGDNSGESVLGGTGANGYLAWNEGNGKANEGLLKAKADLRASAYAYYLSGGIALGLEVEEGVGRNFGQTFDLVWRMNYVDKCLKGQVTTENAEQVKRDLMGKAVDQLYRLFRGTDGKVPGVVFTKDIMTYYPGQVQVWQKWDRDMELPEEERLQELALERSAKIDPYRPDHVRVARRALAKRTQPVL